MTFKSNFKVFVGTTDVIVNTFYDSCLRCGNPALKKTAGPVADLTEKQKPNCCVLVQSCPHCGLWVHAGFVHHRHSEAVQFLKNFGYHEMPCSDDPDYLAMTMQISAAGAMITAKKDGSVDFRRIGGSKDLTDADVARLLSQIEENDMMDTSKTYLSRWKDEKWQLEVITGRVPFIPVRSPQASAWENSLIRPFNGPEDMAMEPFIGILLND